MDRFAQSVQLIARVEVASESDGVEFRNSAFSWDPGRASRATTGHIHRRRPPRRQ
jgi:hypothetical protein